MFTWKSQYCFLGGDIGGEGNINQLKQMRGYMFLTHVFHINGSIWRAQTITSTLAGNIPKQRAHSKLYFDSVSKQRPGKMPPRGDFSERKAAIQFWSWNAGRKQEDQTLKFRPDFLSKKEIWFFVTALIYCRPCLESGIKARLDELPPWTFPLINAGATTAWKNGFCREHQRRGDQVPSKLSKTGSWSLMGLGSTIVPTRTAPKTIANGDRPLESEQVPRARKKVKHVNPPLQKIARHCRRKTCREQEVKEQESYFFAAQWQV